MKTNTSLLKIILNVTLLFAMGLSSHAFASGFFNISTSDLTISITTSIPNHTYPIAGIKINSSGYSIRSGCTPIGNGYCLFSVSDTSPANIIIQGVSGTVAATLCLNGQGPLSCQNYSFPIDDNIVYVANTGNNSVSICPIISSGIMEYCTASFGTDSNGTPTLNYPVGIAINPAHTFAYVLNYENNSLSICPIINNMGSLGACTVATDPSFSGPNGAAINSAGTFLYVLNDVNNTVSVCPINSNGTLQACTIETEAAFDSPEFIALHTIGASTYAYIPDGTNSIVICPIQPTGLFGTCTIDTDPNLVSPQAISFNVSGAYAYVSNYDGGSVSTVSTCPVDSNGSLGACSSGVTGNGTFDFSEGWQSALFMFDNDNYGYIPNNGTDTVSVCPINTSNGSLGTCTAADDDTFDEPSAVTLLKQ